MILVVGATGLVGGMIARELLRQGHALRILTRSDPAYQELVAVGAQAAPGDLKDPASLARACEGVDALITTASAGQRGGVDTPQSVDLEGNRNLIAAARAAGVKQFIYVSALTASVDHPVALARAKAETEATLRDSGLAYTIIAANGIMDVMLPLLVGDRVRAGQPVTLVAEGRRRHSYVAAHDVAAFAVAAIGHPAALNRRVAVGGPQPLSWRDIVAEYERSLGRSLSVRWIAPGELLPDLPTGLTELVSGLLAGLETFDSPVDMTDTSRTFRVALTPASALVDQEMRVDNAIVT